MKDARKPLISASVLGADLANLGDAVRAAEDAGCDEIHFDVMDGQFVSNISMGAIVFKSVAKISELPLEAHMMVVEPERFVDEYAQAGCATYTFHIEACRDNAVALAQKIADAGMLPGIAINPDTPTSVLEEVLPAFSRVLVMSVHPGASGQGFLESALPKLSQLRRQIDDAHGRQIVAIDGGINAGTIGAASRAGAELLVAASAIFGHQGGVKAAVAELRSRIAT